MSFRLRLHSCLRQSGRGFGVCLDVQAKAWTYLRSNSNGNNKCKSKSRSSAFGEG